jgi:hypothetical protein
MKSMKASDGDREIIKRFIAQARRRALTVEEMAAEVDMSMSWGRFLINGKIRVLRFRTRSRIQKLLGEI